MAEILIGTCGYYYHTWKGYVYPEETKAKDYLACYSKLFNTVELDFTYYSMPKAKNLANMLIDGGPDLRFSIKAHRTLTHKIDPSQWEDEAKTYLEALEPMLNSGRLDAVLFQFPYSFEYKNENRRYLDNLIAFFNGVPLAIEFRKDDWYSQKVIAEMKDRNVPLVSLDMPDLPKLPSMKTVITAPLAYIRFHGRNNAAWWGDDEKVRYDYFYTDNEIEEWAQRIKQMSGQAEKILVYFNNAPRGQAVQNAKILVKKLGLCG